MDRLSRQCLEAVASGLWPPSVGLVFRAKDRLEREDAARRRRLAKSRPRRDNAKAKRRAEREETGNIRRKVFERAAGGCEAYTFPLGTDTAERCGEPPEILDHWLGGSGRRRPKQSVETCWALCGDCNDDRTANFPDADWWNESFRLHCQANGYPFLGHRT